jgi:predicted ATPase
MFTNFRLENFKSYRESTLQLAPLTLMIGANASGKTNALEAIRFLSWLSQGVRLEDVVNDVRDLDISIRGSLGELGYHGASTFKLGCSQSEHTAGDWRHFEIELSIGQDDLQILNESVTSDGSKVPLYAIAGETKEYRYEVNVEYNNFARGGRKPQIPCSNRRPIFTQLDTPSRFNNSKSQDVIPNVTEHLRKSLEQILFLDPSPNQMRGYSHKSETDLESDGRNISGVLYHLCDNGRKDDVLGFIRSLPEQDIQDVRFLQTQRQDVMVELVESFGHSEEQWDASMLSDGTLRVLAIAAAVLSAPEGSLIAVEEIDNGVHPSRAGHLLQRIQEVAKERNLRVLLTSHNPALLDSLPNDAVPNVVCCYRNPDEGDSRLVRLSEIDQYPELVARGPLGRLMTKGIIEEYVKSTTTEEERQSRDEAWLEELKSDLDLEGEVR